MSPMFPIRNLKTAPKITANVKKAPTLKTERPLSWRYRGTKGHERAKLKESKALIRFIARSLRFKFLYSV
jgi:hypothetical protein